MSNHRRPFRLSAARLASVMLAAGLALSGLPALAVTPGSDQPATGVAEVEQQVRVELAAQDTTTFWVYLRDRADLRPAADITDRGEQGKFVYRALIRTAGASQAGLVSMLAAERVDHEAFWIANAVRVTGDEPLLDRIAARPEVAQITAEREYRVPEPEPAEPEARIQNVEWGVDRIRAPQVWSTFGVTGEDIVVGSIDTGVQFDHPALVAQYRGNLGDGQFDHNYHWWDPSQVCGSPSLVPCDNNGHGTHVTGTMIGDDGGDNQIGVAPGATWIAAKGCESRTCSQPALLSAGQFMLAPTDLAGNNPDPQRRPHIVNNSWGGQPTSDPWFRSTVQAWLAAGIFPQFSAGNSGPGCGTAGNPGNLPESYAAGAFDINDNLYVLSSRGGSAFGGVIKPDLTAPGVNVRSAWNDGGYNAISGTSMASPHVAATVALMWSAAPALVRDVDATRDLLDLTAIDTEDLSCGGTPANNNVWGEGRLDAFAAVERAPRGPVGRLAGTVIDAGSQLPIAGATITITGAVERTRTTGADGSYAATLPVGAYQVTASRFGYVSLTIDVTIAESETLVRDFALVAAPTWSVSGLVRDPDGDPVAGATVTLVDTPLDPVTTGPDGSYRFDAVPEDTYQVTADAGRCHDQQTRQVVVAGDTTAGFTLPWRTDEHGYLCQEDGAGYVEGDTPLGLSGLDEWVAHPLPFAFPFYGEFPETAYISTKGYLNFRAGNAIFSNTGLPTSARPNAAVYPFWDDLEVDEQASMWTGLRGEAPQREYVIEWRNVTFESEPLRVDVGVVLHENGDIRFQYRNIADDLRERGDSATIGIEAPAGSIAHEFAFAEAVLPAGESTLRYRLSQHAFLRGTVTDGDAPIAGARVVATAGSEPVQEVTTGADGSYRMWLPLDQYKVTVSASGYGATARPATLDTEGESVTVDVALDRQREGFAWQGDFYGPGVDSVVYSSTVWDDGRGPALYAGGAFDSVEGQRVNGIARWDGEAWTPLGSGLDGIVEALVVYDGQLIAGGSFTHAGGVEVNGVARWDGSQWHALGGGMGGSSSPTVLSLAVFDGDLIAGGNFLQAEGQTVNRIARWDGQSWAPLGSGMNNRVSGLVVYERELIAGGAFRQAGGGLVNGVARWNGTRWAPLSGPNDVGVDAVVFDVAVHDGEVIAGGVFERAGGVAASLVARWDGVQWSAMGAGFQSDRTSAASVRSFAVFDGALVAGGTFTHTGDDPVHQVARWDGAAWSPLGAGLDGIQPQIVPHAYTLTVYDSRLVAGGSFTDAGGTTVNRIAAWDGTQWSGLTGGSGPNTGLNRFPLALAEFDGDLIVGGDFSHAGENAVRHLARWDGQTWSAMASGMTGITSGVSVRAMVEFQGDLIVAGHFTHIDGLAANHIARWDGQQWHPLAGPGGSGVGGPSGSSVEALAVYNGALVAAGHFTQAGGVSVNHIARWDGTEWTPLGNGVRHLFTAASVEALAVHDGALFAGGGFLRAGDGTASNIARWDGQAWSALAGPAGEGVNGSVTALAEFDGALVVGGSFRTAGGAPASRIARWDGEWSTLGAGVSSQVRALTVFGGELIAGGGFREAGGAPANFIAAWNGVAWSELAGPAGAGTESSVFALAVLPPGTAGHRLELLAVGGAFSVAGGRVNWGLALYGPVETAPGEIGLDVTPRRDKGDHVVDLSWQGASSAEVDIHRDGALLTTVANTGTHTDHPGGRGRGSYTYQVCEAGTNTCSEEVTAQFGGGSGPAASSPGPGQAAFG